MGVFGSPPREASANGTKKSPNGGSTTAHGSTSTASEPVARRRRPGVAALGVALVALGGLAGGWLVVNAGQTEPVLVMARPVAYGQRIEAGDVTVARVAVGPKVATVPAARREEIVGRYAATNLAQGVVVAGESVMAAPLPGATSDLVGVAVPRSGMPSTPLRPRQPVQIVATPEDAFSGATESTDSADSAPSTVMARVVSVGRPDAEGTRVVDVLVPAGQGARLAALAASGQVALVVRPVVAGGGS